MLLPPCTWADVQEAAKWRERAAQCAAAFANRLEQVGRRLWVVAGLQPHARMLPLTRSSLHPPFLSRRRSRCRRWRARCTC